ncbi:MAG: 16S rRNA (uracil(1498)-N(3))-methyltransferase [Candidatus Rokubacteria bacterium]|nr:16S rRNA (uracil(1498)-N(3))-methyltransferase [Candidatus Rokubacteria bacterium]
MTRLPIGPESLDGDRVRFAPDDARHLFRVLRCRAGDRVEAMLAAPGVPPLRLTVTLTRIDARGAEGAVQSREPLRTESPLRVSLVQGIAKGDKMETIIRTSTELGVAQVLPVVTARTVAGQERERWPERHRRWQRVAREAAKQCGRAVVPDIAEPRPFAEWIAAAPVGDLTVCLWEDARESLGARLPAGPVERATLVVGPEGGLARAEVERLREAGALVTGLGPRILRTETAAPVGLALLQLRYGDLDPGR